MMCMSSLCITASLPVCLWLRLRMARAYSIPERTRTWNRKTRWRCSQFATAITLFAAMPFLNIISTWSICSVKAPIKLHRLVCYCMCFLHALLTQIHIRCWYVGNMIIKKEPRDMCFIWIGHRSCYIIPSVNRVEFCLKFFGNLSRSLS